MGTEKKGFVYLIKSLHLYKIGYTTARWTVSNTYIKPLPKERIDKGVFSDLRNRIETIKSHNPHNVVLITWGYVEHCKKLESELHIKYHSKRVIGEWFKLNKSEVTELKKILTKTL